MSLDMSKNVVERGTELPLREVLVPGGTLSPLSAMYARPLVGMPCDWDAMSARPSLEPRRLRGRRREDEDELEELVVAEEPK